MKFYDVSLLISDDMLVWPGDPGVSMSLRNSLSKGDQANVTQIQMGVHTGTHIDAPFHFEPEGRSIDELHMETLMGPCKVIEMLEVKGAIGAFELKNIDFEGASRILFKTRNSKWWELGEKEFQEEFVYLGEDGAKFLIDQGVKLVGIDYLSIESFASSENAVHHLLLRNEVIIVEGLNLSKVSSGDYELIALPLRLKGADGAPARVVLRKESYLAKPK